MPSERCDTLGATLGPHNVSNRWETLATFRSPNSQVKGTSIQSRQVSEGERSVLRHLIRAGL